MLDFSSDNESFLSISSHNDSFVSIPSLAETLECHFADVPGNLNVVHINAQSIPAHFPDMLTTFECKNLHAILISESWLKPCLSSVTYSLPNFHLIRNDRTGSGGGGVAIYLRDNIPFKILDISSQPPPLNAGEHLFLELDLFHSKVLLGVFYCPNSRISYFSSLEHILELHSPSYSHTIIMGDFNTCLLKRDSRSSTLCNIVESCNLSILPLNATHNFPNSVPSLLDLILVSSPSLVSKHGQYPADSFSYHDLIFLSYKLRPPKAKAKILLQRNFGGMDIDQLRKDASSIVWDSIHTAECIDDKINEFNKSLIGLYDIHAPVRAIKIKRLPSPWITDEIRLLLNKKALAKSKLKCRPTTTNKESYIAIRNHCSKVCRKAQRQHIHDSVENGNPAKVWKFLRTLGVGKSRQASICKNTDFDLLNKHFTSSPLYDEVIKTRTLNTLSSLPLPDYPSFVFNQVSACDVKKSVISITSKAIGSDSISRNMILPVLDEILPVMCHILNHSLSFGLFPTAWKEAQIIPLPKNSNPLSFSDYRPISILPFLSKVLERLVHIQLSAYLNNNHLLNPYQSGFRPGYSTATALVNVTDDIRHGMENGNLTVLSLLDFSNAFNTVDFHILLGILRSINISPSVVDWFHSYLSGRRQRIRIEESYSSWCDITVGVPQGGVLSPLLFAIFINSISKQLQSSYHLYADDLQIYTQASSHELHNAFSMINADLERISEWSLKYGLTVNPTKTQIIVIGSSRIISRINWTQLPQITFNGISIPLSESVKNLGILIDRTFSWGPQLCQISRKLFAAAGSLRRLKNFLPITTKIALVQSLLLPILDYADVSYLDLTEEQLDRLERLQNFCIRFIFGLRKYDHVSHYRNKLKWLPIRLRRNTHILSLVYNTLFNPSTPVYLKERLQFLNDTHSKSLRSSANLRLKIPTHSTNFFGKSFTVQAARLWNALPVSIRRAQSIASFKSMVKNHYLTL